MKIASNIRHCSIQHNKFAVLVPGACRVQGQGEEGLAGEGEVDIVVQRNGLCYRGTLLRSKLLESAAGAGNVSFPNLLALLLVLTNAPTCGRLLTNTSVVISCHEIDQLSPESFFGFSFLSFNILLSFFARKSFLVSEIKPVSL